MRAGNLAVALLSVVLVSSMLSAPSAGAQEKETQEWLFLVYLDADNSLDVSVGAHHESVVGSDIAELSSVGSSDDVTCYALIDRYAGPTNLFRFTSKGVVDEMTDFSLNDFEANMGDPATLRAYVEYAMAESPSEHILLIFWDHGSPRGVAWDDHTTATGGEDYLSHWEVADALQGYKVDVIGADECNVGHTEVAYEYATSTQTEYLVAAETYTGWRGFPYDALLRELTAHPGMTPREVAMMMIEQTQILLDKPPYSGERINSHAAIELGQMRGLADSMKALTDMLTPNIAKYSNSISRARGIAQYVYGANAINLIDLETFIKQIGARANSQAVKTACVAVLESYEAAVISVQASGILNWMIGGMGIAFPDHSWELPGYYEDFAFASQGWLSFMEACWAVHGSV